MSDTSSLHGSLVEQFGDIDVYLFDQLLRRRIVRGMRVLDAGCGYGRNLVYMLRERFDVSAVDANADALTSVQRFAREVAPDLPASNFRVEHVEEMSFADGAFDVVISSAVLHFARDAAHFEAMLNRMWRVLAPGGLLFCRLASSTGIESRVVPTTGGRYRLPDGSERFLVAEEQLAELTRTLGGTLVDPIKSTIVQNMRCMATWVVRASR